MNLIVPGASLPAMNAATSAIARLTPVVATSVPTSGQTVAAAGNVSDYTLWLAPAATLAALTVNLPLDSLSQIGDIYRIGSSKTITALTLAGPATIFDSASSLSPNQIVSYKKLAADTWDII